MSDGPHKSLPMRAGWKKFAERADKAAYDPEQVADLAIPALEGDWREEVAPHIDSLRKALGDGRQGLLFGEQRTAELKALKRLNPGAPLWHAAKCPKCGSKKVSFVPGRIYVVTTKKS